MTIKKTVSLLLALLMIFSCAASFTACKNNKDDNIDDLPKTKRTSVYKEDPLDIKIAANYIDRVMCDGENLLMTYYKNYTVVYDNEGKEVERFDGYYYNYGGNDEVFFYDEAVSYIGSSAMVTVPDVNASADSDGKEKENLKGEADEFGVITDENRNIQVPEGWWTNWESEQVISSVPVTGGDVKTIPLKFDSIIKGVDENGEEKQLYDYGSVRSLFLGNDGKTRILYNASSYDNVTYTSKNDYYILTIDIETGEVTDKKLLNDSFKSAGIDDSDYVYINSVVLLDNGNIVFSMENGRIYQVDGNMNLVKSYEISDGDGYAELLSIGEKVIVGMYDYNSGKYIFKYIADGELRDVNTDADLSRFGSFVGGYGDRIYAQSDMSVMYLDIVTGEVGEELNFINSDIDFTRINSIALIGDGKMVMTSYDWQSDDSGAKFSVMTKVPDDEIEEEVILTLGAVYQNYRLIRAIMRFNKKGTGVRINFKSYNQYNNQENEWKGAVTQLNSEIISGTLPDILYLTSDLPVQSYFNKGYFVDLNKYIDDSEKGLDRSKYFDNILRANETNGKLYSIISTFSFNTLAGKTEFVGSEPGWTFEEMMKVVNSMPEGMELMYGVGRELIISTMIEGSLSSYVDWSTGETKFDTPEFIQFITYLKTCPEKGLWEEYYDSMGDEWVYDEETEREIDEKLALKFWNNTSLLDNVYISGFESLQWIYNEFATRDVTFIGFPTNDEDGNGVFIAPNAEFAISAKSKAKALAWEAVKGLIEDTEDNYNFSIIREKTGEIEKTVYERIEEEEKNNNDYYNDYSWYEEYGFSEDYINYMKNSNVKLDREMVQEVRNLIESASVVSREDDKLFELINEELSSFFGGAKSAEETARIIASRAKIVISERS